MYLFLYESSDLSLEDVDAMYCDPNCKSWSSRDWAPEGFASRREFVQSKRTSEKHTVGEGGVGVDGGKARGVAKLEDVRLEHAQGNATSNGTMGTAPPPAYESSYFPNVTGDVV